MEITASQKLTTFLMLEGGAEEAITSGPSLLDGVGLRQLGDHGSSPGPGRLDGRVGAPWRPGLPA